MTRGVKPAQPFVLKNDDEIFLTKIPERLVEALRAVHPPESVSYEQAALDLGIPVGTVKSRVNRARERVLRMRQNAAEGRPNVVV